MTKKEPIIIATYQPAKPDSGCWVTYADNTYSSLVDVLGYKVCSGFRLYFKPAEGQ